MKVRREIVQIPKEKNKKKKCCSSFCRKIKSAQKIIKLRFEAVDAYQIVKTVVNSFMIPFQVAFDAPFTNTTLFDLATDAINYLFLLDILITFRTSRLNLLTGEEIKDPKLIAKDYILSWSFWIDLISFIPIDKLGTSDTLSLFNILKTILKLLNIIFIQLVVIHMLGCLYYYVCTINKTWYPPSDSLQPDALNFYNDQDYVEKYWTAIYYAVLIYSVNDIGATAVVERALVGYLGIFFAIFNANMFGLISMLIQDLNQGKYIYLAETQTAAAAMNTFKLPTTIERLVKNYIVMTQKQRAQPQELKSFLDKISNSLKLKVYIHELQPLFLTNIYIGQVFKNTHQSTIDQMIKHMNLNLAYPEEIILTQGDTILVSGICNVIQKDQIKNEDQVIRQLKKNEFFGLQIFLGNHAETSSNFKIYFFKKLSEDDKDSLIFNFKIVNFEKGNMILNPGDISQSLMLVSKGIVEVYTHVNKNTEFPIEFLRRGAVICHHLFLFKKPVLLPFRCQTNVELMVLSLNKVQLLIRKNPNSSLNLEMQKIFQDFATLGYDRLFMDCLAGFQTDNRKDPAKYERNCIQNRIIKNSGIFVLTNYREKNKKPQINEILRDLIQKKKEMIKLQKNNLASLMKNYGKNGAKNKEVIEIVTPPSEVKKIQIFVYNIQRQVQYQAQQIESISRRFKFAFNDGTGLQGFIKREKFKQKRGQQIIFGNLEDEIYNQFYTNETLNDDTGKIGKSLFSSANKKIQLESQQITLNNEENKTFSFKFEDTDILSRLAKQSTLNSKSPTIHQKVQSLTNPNNDYEQFNTSHVSNHIADESILDTLENDRVISVKEMLQSKLIENLKQQTMLKAKISQQSKSPQNTTRQLQQMPTIQNLSPISEKADKFFNSPFTQNYEKRKLLENFLLEQENQVDRDNDIFGKRLRNMIIVPNFKNEIKKELESLGMNFSQEAKRNDKHLLGVEWHQQQQQNESKSQFSDQSINNSKQVYNQRDIRLIKNELQDFEKNIIPNTPSFQVKEDLQRYEVDIADRGNQQRQGKIVKKKKKKVHSQSGQRKNAQLWENENIQF
ncbi:UNKNOWN [Stylonychia lemnae]|uniref:Cyclic nucleotide-binding domain-containing protein n=1 Tax=Stylonychia lemnae TaxID=5949 RepID=A0A078ABU8_STYLE|nr:UNKNOWN [Stylonychia lemnae]|eukprot:CDW78253.1 UNKNOWN [Stylonychia lemnae]